MNKLIITLIIVLLIYADGTAQSFKRQKTGFVISNIGINGLVGGLGAIANKKKGEKTHKVFLKGFSQGCLGGTISHFGRELTYPIGNRERLEYAWLARFTNSVGASITQNAASNINFWEHWHFNLGLVRMDYDIKDKKFQARVFPSAVAGAIMIGRRGKFNLKRSLQTGIMIFERDGLLPGIDGFDYDGLGYISSIGMNTNITGNSYYRLMAHETMHILQYDSRIWINPFLNKTNQRLKSKSKLYNSLGKYIYFDFNGIVLYGTSLIQLNQPWICRYIEREADHYSRQYTLPKCN